MNNHIRCTYTIPKILLDKSPYSKEVAYNNIRMAVLDHLINQKVTETEDEEGNLIISIELMSFTPDELQVLLLESVCADVKDWFNVVNKLKMRTYHEDSFQISRLL